MAFLLLGVRLFLAAVFGVAATGKLADLSGFRRSLGGFGVPRPAIGALGVVVPMAELMAAVLLVADVSAWWGAAASLALLAVFTVAVGVALSRGRTPDCRCFGQVSAAPISVATLVRNMVLASGATLLLVAGPGATLER